MEIENISLNKIKLNKNSRMDIKEEDLSDLMGSIKEQGLLQPIGLVTRENGYEIAYGNRRFLAYSNLGKHSIPAIVYKNETEANTDLKNLAENIQRKNVSLGEIGRYLTHLQELGLSSKEMAIRLSVSKSYIDACKSAYQEVPKKFQGDLETTIGGRKLGPGKIAIKTATAIINAAKTNRLNEEEKEQLFKAAKSSDNFRVENVKKYANEIKAGNKKFVEKIQPVKHVIVNFLMNKRQFDELHEKHIQRGNYKSMNKLFQDILSGAKSIQIKIEKK